MLFTLRISLPDKPGMLGAVASALGNAGANILTLEVVDREDGFAVDDLLVEAPEGITEARRRAEQVTGVVVEAARPVEAFREVITPVELAAALAEATGDVIKVLVDGLPRAFWATWSLALSPDRSSPQVIASSFGAPGVTNLETPWLPLEGPRRLKVAQWMPPSWRLKAASGLELAAVPLYGPDSAVLVGRRRGPRFRSSELRQIAVLTRIALLAEERSVGVPA